MSLKRYYEDNDLDYSTDELDVNPRPLSKRVRENERGTVSNPIDLTVPDFDELLEDVWDLEDDRDVPWFFWDVPEFTPSKPNEEFFVSYLTWLDDSEDWKAVWDDPAVGVEEEYFEYEKVFTSEMKLLHTHYHIGDVTKWIEP
jgi:hypothetical protein